MNLSKQPVSGDSDFESVIHSRHLYVDKSMFIKEFLEDPAKNVVILRSRRFGKSLNLSMLEYFLSVTKADWKLFEKLNIRNDIGFKERLFGKYPVIRLDFKDLRQNSWTGMLSFFTMKVELWLKYEHKLSYSDLRIDPNEPDQVKSALSELIHYLHEEHKSKVYILIDEFDTPLNNALQKGFYEDAFLFFKDILSTLDNPFVEKSCLIGIVEPRGPSILSAVKDHKIYPMYVEAYSFHFGFTADEIYSWIGDRSRHLEVLHWYSGYKVGRIEVMNPWSICQWLKYGGQFGSYWVLSSSETISDFLAPLVLRGSDSLLQELMKFATNLAYQKHMCRPSTTCNYGSEEWPDQAVWDFLINTGYLNFVPGNTGDGHFAGYARIPNEEIRRHLTIETKNLIIGPNSEHTASTLENALMRPAKPDFELLEETLRVITEFPTFQSLMDDLNSYYIFFMCVFMSLPETIANVSSRSTGNDEFAGIYVKTVNPNRVFIFEFEKSDRPVSRGRIVRMNKRYALENGFEYYAIGITFCGKQLFKLRFKQFK